MKMSHGKFSDHESSLTQRILLNEARKEMQLNTGQLRSHLSLPSNGKLHLLPSDLVSRPLPKPIPSPVKDDQDEVNSDPVKETFLPAEKLFLILNFKE